MTYFFLTEDWIYKEFVCKFIMTKPDRMISTSDIRIIIDTGKVIEDYPVPADAGT